MMKMMRRMRGDMRWQGERDLTHNICAFVFIKPFEMTRLGVRFHRLNREREGGGSVMLVRID